MNYLAMLLVLGFLILVHELGHLAAARAVGMPVAAFSVGFGPKLASRTWRGTEYALRAVPLGGYVLPDAAGPEDLAAIPFWRRVTFYLAGPVANLLVVVPLFAIGNWIHAGASLDALLVAPFAQTASALRDLLALLPALFARPEQLSGALGIVVGGAQAVAAGRGLDLAIVLSLNLAVLNLLPIPILDGGQILLAGLERLGPRWRRLRVPATVAGLVAIVALMLYALGNDVVRLLA